MYRPPSRGRPTPSFPRNPYFFRNPSYHRTPPPQNFQNVPPPLPAAFQNSNFFSSFPPGVPQNAFPFPPANFPASGLSEIIGTIEAAVKKASQDLLSSGENVSAWKVSQAALLALQVDSWSSLGFQMQNIPSLHRLIVTEGKVDSFIHCFVAVRRITSVHELEVALCASEGIEQFEVLGLGPLLRHPLVVHYFSVPGDAREVCKITTEEIVLALAAYDKCKRNISVDEFLGFLKEKHSVTDKEKLGVRIHSLGLHIKCIREAKQAEYMTLRNSSEFVKYSCSKRKSDGKEPQSPSMIPQKVVLDRKFASISERVKAFASSLDELCNSHIRFASSDDDDPETKRKFSPQCKDSSQRVSSCPYPSTTEEMTRLGIKRENCKKRCKSNSHEYEMPSAKKRKLNKQPILHPLDKFVTDMNAKKKGPFAFPSYLEEYFILTDSELQRFVRTWREICKDNTAVEVLNMLLGCYRKKKRQKLLSMVQIFSSHPGIGLLNVAMVAVKCGILGNYKETSPSFVKDGLVDQACNSLEEDNASPAKESEVAKKSATVGDIVDRLSAYFSSGYINYSSKQQPLEKMFVLLRLFWHCESWLASQFLVEKFSCLGYGDFLEFIEKNISLLPGEVQKFLMGEGSQISALQASMVQRQLEVFLSHTRNKFSEKNISGHDYICTLLDKQFPTIKFQISGNESRNLSSDTLKNMEDSHLSGSVVFSTTLLGKQLIEKNPSRLSMEMVHHDYVSQFSSEDAVKCLTKAPMLSDLYSWSHWDVTYAPSLGPFLQWLLNGHHSTELPCIATRDGKFIRIDHSATAEEFLEAAMQGSSFQAAVKLLSLVYLYGGTSEVPSSLLKHFAERAIEVIIRNSMDVIDVKNCEDERFSYQRSTDQLFVVSDNRSDSLSSNKGGQQKILDSTFSDISCFILNCLCYLPPEFQSFAAEILVSGLQSFRKDAYSLLLCECKQIYQRAMLHYIGFSLGVVEWIEDYNAFSALSSSDLIITPSQFSSRSPGFTSPVTSLLSEHKQDIQERINHKTVMKHKRYNALFNEHEKESVECLEKNVLNEDNNGHGSMVVSEGRDAHDAALLIESIRREEFGLEPNLDHPEGLLKKQHARLGRALHCLSQELYSQDSHLLLELIQNADDNSYPDDVDPSLIFILRANSIVVLNNEEGFTTENIRALCDVGNSTKKGASGYIGHKGIGFKSVFRITDAPEIHSNGFHVKFDISDGQIGFILPRVIFPCDISIYTRELSCDGNQTDYASWKTCIVLPFRSKLREEAGISSVVSLFSDLHPSLLLFLHRLKCIMYRNMLSDTFIFMKRENLGDGIVKVSHGSEKMSWLVVRQRLKASMIRPDVQSTEIAIAFTLQECDNGGYRAHLSRQPVFAFLPLRQYGLKCILQGDFVLPSSREEVDGNSAWNQWLLSEFPAFFVASERSFSNLPCFKDYPGKAVSAFMSFVPLVGEVYGFFSQLPNMILSRLRVTNCLLLDGHCMEWVPPCRVLRGWDDQARLLIPDSMLEKHLGLGYLKKDIILSDSLARALGIKNYGPKILVDMILSICNINSAIEHLGFDWLSSWFVALSLSFSVHFKGDNRNLEMEFDLSNTLKKIPFIPLSDGSYGSVSEGPIWFPFDSFSTASEGRDGPKVFPHLYKRLRTVNSLLFSAPMSFIYILEERREDNLIRILQRIGVQQLSAHDIIKSHILQGLVADFHKGEDVNLMIEYLSFVMLHLQYDCVSCRIEKDNLILELRNKPVIVTNHGCKCPIEEPIHFSKEFGNPVNTDFLIGNEDIEWHEVDVIYLKHPSTLMLKSAKTKWREFFLAMGVTDFVQVIRVDKNPTEFFSNSISVTVNDDHGCSSSLLSDWESPELVRILTKFSSRKYLDKCKYLLEVLDRMWDNYGVYTTSYVVSGATDEKREIESSFMKSICNIKWIASSMDKELHYPKDLYFDCETVHSILGGGAPYALPQVSSKKLLKDIGFKTQVSIDDAMRILELWRMSGSPCKSSIAQMSRFYYYIWDRCSSMEESTRSQFKSSSWIFVPFMRTLKQKDAVPGLFVSPSEVYWNDPTGCLDQIREIIFQSVLVKEIPDLPYRAVGDVYPGLHDFFVNECGVHKVPSFCDYVEILLQLSTIALPSQAAHAVFRAMLKWADDLKAGVVKQEEVLDLKKSLSQLETRILPTIQGKWVSLHPNFGLVCWSDDEELRIQFKDSSDMHFLHFGILNNEDKNVLSGKVASLMQTIGVPALSEVVCREAIFYGIENNQGKVFLVNWILPYAQRYIYKFNLETYLHQKQVVLERLGQLKIFVVDKLYYKHSLKGQNSNSKKRYECCSLLQGNILYTTANSDSHSIYLELSRAFFDGSASLHLANFLHMITAMAESGNSDEQIELFIVNSQKVPKLPPQESPWSLSSVQPEREDTNLHISPAAMSIEENTAKASRKPGISSNWPPTDWKSAPGFGTGLTYQINRRQIMPSHGSSFMDSGRQSNIDQIYSDDITVNLNADGGWILEDNSAKTASMMQDQGNSRKHAHVLDKCSSAHTPYDVESVALEESTCGTGPKGAVSSSSYVGDHLSANTSNEEESYRTGRLGEAAAYRYFSEKSNSVAVNWVNMESETGLPYDLLIGENDEDRQYIEVKTTKSKNKNWFPITSREWQFAFEKGDAFSIARVVLTGPNRARITVLRNPLKLCQKNILHLAILMS